MENQAISAIKLIENLNERAKELQCIYRVENILKDFDSDLITILQKLAEQIPPGWQYPEICKVRIELEDMLAFTHGMKYTDWFQESDIKVDDDKKGSIKIYYIDKVYFTGKSPFLKEEQKLLDTIASRIGNYIFNRGLKDAYKKIIETQKSYKSGEDNNERLYNILRNSDTKTAEKYLETPSADIGSFKELEQILEVKSDKHWQWRLDIASLITRKMGDEKTANERFGVKAVYVFGSTITGESGPGSDIDLLVHFEGSDFQKEILNHWLQGWSLCLAEMNYQKTGYKTDGLLDVHCISNEDIENKTSYAAHISSTDEPASLLPFDDTAK